MNPQSWEEVWDLVQRALLAIAQQSQAQNPRIWFRIDHFETESFPFNGYLAISRDGTPGDEDLVIAVSAQRKESELRWSTDISRGDGLVLADATTFVGQADNALHTWLGEAVQSTMDFLEEQRQLIIEEVS